MGWRRYSPERDGLAHAPTGHIMRELSLAEFAAHVGRMLAGECDALEVSGLPVAVGMLGIVLKHSEAYTDAPPLVRVMEEEDVLYYELDEQRALALGFI